MSMSMANEHMMMPTPGFGVCAVLGQTSLWRRRRRMILEVGAGTGSSVLLDWGRECGARWRALRELKRDPKYSSDFVLLDLRSTLPRDFRELKYFLSSFVAFYTLCSYKAYKLGRLTHVGLLPTTERIPSPLAVFLPHFPRAFTRFWKPDTLTHLVHRCL